jgi:hypothetical protein
LLPKQLLQPGAATRLLTASASKTVRDIFASPP